MRSNYPWIAIASACRRQDHDVRQAPQSPWRINIATAASRIVALPIAPTRNVTGIGGPLGFAGYDGWRGGGTAPIWMKTSRVLSSSQCSTKRPSSTRQMSIERIAKGLPVAE
jgi:hypothetical protein